MIQTRKKLRSLMCAVTVGLMAGAMSGVANAGLLGKHVNLAFGTVPIDTFVPMDGPVNLLVINPGAEALSFGQVFNVDFSDTGLHIDVVNLPNGFAVPASIFIGLVALNFEGNSLSGLVSGDTNIAGFESLSSNGQSRLLLGSQFLAFNFEGLSLINGDFVEVGLNLVPAIAVPEPASWALMLSGLGVLGLLARRRRHWKIGAGHAGHPPGSEGVDE